MTTPTPEVLAIAKDLILPACPDGCSRYLHPVQGNGLCSRCGAQTAIDVDCIASALQRREDEIAELKGHAIEDDTLIESLRDNAEAQCSEIAELKAEIARLNSSVRSAPPYSMPQGD